MELFFKENKDAELFQKISDLQKDLIHVEKTLNDLTLKLSAIPTRINHRNVRCI